MLYGTHGIGKSTFASCAPKPVFIQTEDGLGEIDCDKFPLATTFDQAMQALSELYTDEHPYRTVVVDSLDWLERLIWAEVCRKRNVESIEDIGYAKGYVFALTQWREFLEGLSALRSDKGMTIDPDRPRPDRALREPRDRVATTATCRACTAWRRRSCRSGATRSCSPRSRSTPSRPTRASTASATRASAPASGSSARVERPAHVAKNRLNLPEEMPLDWNAYAQHLTTEPTAAPQGGKSKGAK